MKQNRRNIFSCKNILCTLAKYIYHEIFPPIASLERVQSTKTKMLEHFEFSLAVRTCAHNTFCMRKTYAIFIRKVFFCFYPRETLYRQHSNNLIILNVDNFYKKIQKILAHRKQLIKIKEFYLCTKFMPPQWHELGALPKHD